MNQPAILVVEDESAIADNITYALRSEGFTALWATTGARALQLLEEQPAALVILDIGLPDISGFELCRQIRARWGMPIIFLSARDAEVDRVVGLEIGGDDYVVKPFSPRELVARVRARLRPPPDRPVGPQAQSPGFQVDEAQRCIRYADQVLDLTRYEYRLFATLLANPRRVWSREQLLEQAWEQPEHAFDRTVDTHIKTLRQKIRASAARREPIRTHRGQGYSYDPDS